MGQQSDQLHCFKTYYLRGGEWDPIVELLEDRLAHSELVEDGRHPSLGDYRKRGAGDWKGRA